MSVQGEILTLPGLLFDQARQRPLKPAIREKDLGIWQEVTWSEYATNARKTAMGFYALGLRKGGRIGVMADSVVEWMYSQLGAQSIGATCVGLYPTYLEPSVSFVMQDCAAEIFIAGDQEHLDKVLAVEHELPALHWIIVIDTKGVIGPEYDHPKLMTFDDLIRKGEQTDAQDPAVFDRLLANVMPDDVAMIGYTSGSTGNPKGAMLTHRNFCQAGRSLQQGNPVTDRDNLVNWMPLCHPANQTVTIMLPLLVGSVVNFAENADTLDQALFEIAPSFFNGVPRLFETWATDITIRMQKADWLKQFFYRAAMRVGRRYAESRLKHEPIGIGLRVAKSVAQALVFNPILDKLGLKRVRIAYCGGAATSPDLLMFFHSMGLRVREVYGSAEMCGIVTCHQGDDVVPGNAGKPLHNVEVKVLPNGDLLQRWKDGSAFAGYLNRPDSTADTLLEGGWVRLGDTARIDEAGNLVILGRTKELFMTGKGVLVAPAELENKLKFSPYVNEAVVFGENRANVVALIQLEYHSVSEWAQRHQIPYTTFRSLTLEPRVYDLIAKEVETVNATLDADKRIERFALLPKELDQDDEELTPTRKVKRRIIEQAFRSLIEGLYA